MRKSAVLKNLALLASVPYKRTTSLLDESAMVHSSNRSLYANLLHCDYFFEDRFQSLFRTLLWNVAHEDITNILSVFSDKIFLYLLPSREHCWQTGLVLWMILVTRQIFIWQIVESCWLRAGTRARLRADQRLTGVLGVSRYDSSTGMRRW